MKNVNDTSRCYPRTMQEAFGPYTSHTLYEPPEDIDWKGHLIFGAMALLLLVVFVSSLFA